MFCVYIYSFFIIWFIGHSFSSWKSVFCHFYSTSERKIGSWYSLALFGFIFPFPFILRFPLRGCSPSNFPHHNNNGGSGLTSTALWSFTKHFVVFQVLVRFQNVSWYAVVNVSGTRLSDSTRPFGKGKKGKGAVSQKQKQFKRVYYYKDIYYYVRGIALHITPSYFPSAANPWKKCCIISRRKTPTPDQITKTRASYYTFFFCDLTTISDAGSQVFLLLVDIQPLTRTHKDPRMANKYPTEQRSQILSKLSTNRFIIRPVSPLPRPVE